jgi:hypothetical protein
VKEEKTEARAHGQVTDEKGEAQDDGMLKKLPVDRTRVSRLVR